MNYNINSKHNFSLYLSILTREWETHTAFCFSFYCNRGSNLQPTGRMQPRMAVDAAQHKIVDLLQMWGFLWLCVTVYLMCGPEMPQGWTPLLGISSAEDSSDWLHQSVFAPPPLWSERRSPCTLWPLPSARVSPNEPLIPNCLGISAHSTWPDLTEVAQVPGTPSLPHTHHLGSVASPETPQIDRKARPSWLHPQGLYPLPTYWENWSCPHAPDCFCITVTSYSIRQVVSSAPSARATHTSGRAVLSCPARGLIWEYMGQAGCQWVAICPLP